MSDGVRRDLPLRRTITSYDGHATLFEARRKDRGFADDIADAFAACVPTNGLVADAGCGPGYDAPVLRSRGLRVVSLDLSAGMLALARAACPGRCVQADLRALPMRPGALDGIWAMASLVHLSHDEVESTLGEFRDALRPGGAFFSMVKNVDGEGDARRPDDVEDPAGRGLTGWRTGRDGPDDRRWFVYWSGAAYDAALAAAGFRVLGGSANEVWLRRLAVRT